MEKVKEAVKNSSRISEQYPTKRVSAPPSVRILESFRNNDHTINTFLLDPVDNSIDAGATLIRIEFVADENGWKKIRIIDNGTKCMNETQIVQALTLGGDSDKNKKVDLGCHGLGLQNSGLKVAKRITVKSKSKDSDFAMGTLDLDRMIADGDWDLDMYNPIDESQYRRNFREFKDDLNTLKNTGTIIEISNIDRLLPGYFNDPQGLINLIEKELGLTYYYIMRDKGVTILVNGKKVEGRDPLHRDSDFSHEWCNKQFSHNGQTYNFRFHFLDREIKKELRGGLSWDNRNLQFAGLYIYRNRRLVGQSLGLGNMFGFKVGDGYSGGIRAELMISGEGNEFQATNTKQIHDNCAMDQGFRDRFERVASDYIRRARNEDKQNSSRKTKNSDVVLFSKFCANANKNTRWTKNFYPVQHEFVKEKEHGPDYIAVKHHEEYIIRVNIDHMSWKHPEFGLSKKNDEEKMLYFYRILAEAGAKEIITDVNMKRTNVSRNDLMDKIDQERGRLLTILLEPPM